MLKLEDFHISHTNGFLLEDPLKNLPNYFNVWNDLAARIPELVETHRLRDEVNQMPLLDHGNLEGYRQKRLAFLQLSFIGSAYIWQDGDAGVSKFVPESLSVPWWYVARDLGLNPVVCHASVVLANWKRLDITRPRTLDNLELLYGLPGGDSVKWFFLITVQMEQDFVPALTYIESGVECVRQNDHQGLLTCLVGIQEVIQTLQTTLSQMHERLKPEDFYDKLRPFLTGWGGEGSALREGLIFTGVHQQPTKFSGGSAAQSSIFQSLDAFLSINHETNQKDFLLSMRSYMPPDHSAFIETLEQCPSLREHIVNSGHSALTKDYDDCLSALLDFRSYHIQVVTKYVVMMSNRRERNQSYEGVSKQGTGGSNVLPFLKGCREATTRNYLERK